MKAALRKVLKDNELLRAKVEALEEQVQRAGAGAGAGGGAGSAELK